VLEQVRQEIAATDQEVKRGVDVVKEVCGAPFPTENAKREEVRARVEQGLASFTRAEGAYNEVKKRVQGIRGIDMAVLNGVERKLVRLKSVREQFEELVSPLYE
jgi:hypothetical protein